MSTPTARPPRMLLVALVALQVACLVVLIVLLQQGQAVEQRRGALLARAAALATRAAEQQRSGDASGCAQSYRRAARLGMAATELALADGHELGAARCQALQIIATAALPDRERLDSLRHLSARLGAAADNDSLALAAALDAVVLQAEGQLPEALARIQRALEQQGLQSPWLQWQRGTTLLRRGSPADAAAALEPVVAALPTFAPGWHRLGLAHVSQKRHEDGVSALKKSIELDPRSGARFDLARVYMARKQWGEAIPLLQATLKAKQDDSAALRLLASANFHLKRYPEAAAGYGRAYRVDPQPRTLLSAAIALHAGGKHDKALELLDGLLEHAATIPEIRFERGLVLSELKRSGEARIELQRYLEQARGKRSEARRARQAAAHLQRLGGAPAKP